MSNKKIIICVTAFLLVAGTFVGVSFALNNNYNEYNATQTSDTSQNDSESTDNQNDEAVKVKQAVQNITYESELFGDEIMTIDIIADEDDWQNMIDNASDEEYISVDVNVNGTLIENVGIRTKGNSSLTTVESSDSDKYSFKIKFDKYVDDQTCFGLDKLVLNNIVSDNTYMKDYISFDMMKFMGVNGSLYNYSYITVNGEYWGLYVALEAYDKSFLNRTYGDDSGFLYNVKTMNMNEDKNGGGMMPPDDFEPLTTMPEDINSSDDIPKDANPSDDMPKDANPSDDMPKDANPSDDMPEDGELKMPEDFDPENFNPEDFDFENFNPEDMQGGFDQMMNMQDNGGSLIYTDDNWESYSSIFDNAVFNRTSEEDYQRVITALKKLSEGENIDEYFDVDQILRYLAVHTTLVNLDSYSSNMAQNYYIYEKDGVLSILPWDYNLAFGGFSSSDSTSAINFPIDSPVSGVELEDRPLIAKLLEIDEYKEKYHEYLQQIVDEYFNSGYFNNKIDEINNKISSYIETEPQKFCTYEEYETAVSTLKAFGELRAESIKGQLDGSIPSTTKEQQDNSEALITDESINIADMGTQMGGKELDKGMKGEGFNGQRPDKNNDSGNMPEDGEIPSEKMTQTLESDEPTETYVPTKSNNDNAFNGNPPENIPNLTEENNDNAYYPNYSFPYNDTPKGNDNSRFQDISVPNNNMPPENNNVNNNKILPDNFNKSIPQNTEENQPEI
jgi:hypothetical protein